MLKIACNYNHNAMHTWMRCANDSGDLLVGVEKVTNINAVNRP